MFEAFILGFIQGLGEFLPISSSGHLVVAPWLFGFEDPGLGFSVALHLGTLVAVFAYFRSDIWLLVKGFFHSLSPRTRDMQNNIYQKLAWLIIIASIPAGLIGKFLESAAESKLRSPLLVVVTMSTFGIVLYVADQVGKKAKNLDKVSKQDALLIGISQALALIPGVSRSGSTMTAGLALGLKRADAARFSFLMSIPVILGAGVLKIQDFGKGVTGPELLVGFITAAVVGFLSIKFLLQYLTRHNFNLFVWYRLAFAAFVLIVYFAR